MTNTPEPLIVQKLRQGEWTQTVVQGPNPTAFTVDATHVATEAAATIVRLADEVREVAERLSVEAQIGGNSISEETRLRAKMGDCAKSLFKALASLHPVYEKGDK